MSVNTGTRNKAAISAISMLDRRDILKKAVDTQNEEGLADILQLADLYKETKQAEYHDYAEDALFQLLTTTGVVTGSGTPTVSVALTAGTSGYAVKNLQVLFEDGGVGIVTNVTTSAGQDTLTIKSTNGGNLTLVSGQTLAPSAIVVGEGSDETTSQNFGYTKYSNLVQAFRDKNSITDIQKLSDVELEFEGQNYIWNHDIANKFIKFKGGINATFIMGKKSATKYSDATPALTDPGAGGPIQFTGGLNEYVSTYGVSGAVASAGTVALSDFETFINALIAARSPQDHLAVGASKALAKVSNCLKSLGSSASVASARMDVNGKSLDFDVEKFSYMGFIFDFSVLPIMNHPVHFAKTPIVKNLYFIPKGKVATRDGGAVDRISVRYMKSPVENGFGNNIYSEWDTGAMARGGATSGKAVRDTHWLSIQGLHMVGVSQFGKWQVL